MAGHSPKRTGLDRLWGATVNLCRLWSSGARRYLGGVLDFTGELNRYAIAKATVRDVAEVQLCRDIVEGLMGEFLQVVPTRCTLIARLHTNTPLKARRW